MARVTKKPDRGGDAPIKPDAGAPGAPNADRPRPPKGAKPKLIRKGKPPEQSAPVIPPYSPASPSEGIQLEPPRHAVEPANEDDAPPAPKPTGSQADQPQGKTINIASLQAMSMGDLNQMAREMGIENFGTMRKHEVIFHILQKNAERNGVLFSEGVLEVLGEGFGFLRSQSFNYLPCPEDIYVSPSQIRRFDLQTGNVIAGQIRPPKDKERFFALLKVEGRRRRGAGQGQGQDSFRQPDPALPQQAIPA